MIDQLEKLEERYEELARQMAMPDIASNLKQLQTLAQERASIETTVRKFRQYKATSSSLTETKAMLNDGLDEDMTTMVKQEVEKLESKLDHLLQDLKVALVPKDPNDEKDIIVEIRAGAGGDEAGLFAADLFRMYSRYAQDKRWAIDIINVNESGIGAFKEIVFEVKGKGVFSRLKYESGVHRVQRVPTTESSGRVHTSTATVAVLPKAEEVDISVNPDDLKIDIFHSGGAGGQNVNKVATAVRITHIPSGIVTVCQDERSQLQNKIKAMSVLRSRLLDIEQRRQEEKITTARRSQVRTGDRSEKIRTYNFPQDRISDHRIGQNFHNLPRILEGDLNEIIDALTNSDQIAQLEDR